MANEQMTHPLKLHKFLDTHDAQIMTHHTSQTRTAHCVDLALRGQDNMVEGFREMSFGFRPFP